MISTSNFSSSQPQPFPNIVLARFTASKSGPYNLELGADKMCLLEHTTFHYCSHFERVLYRCGVGTCINEALLNFPGLSKHTRHIVSGTHSFCAACRWANLDRGTPPPQTGNNEPVNNEPVDNEPVNNEPVNNEPVNNEPVNNEPVNNEPVNNEPVNNEPVNNEPVTSEPVDNDWEEYESDETESYESERDGYESDGHEPAGKSQQYTLKRAQAKILPNIGLRVAGTCTITDTIPGSYRDGIEVKVRTIFPFVNPRVLAYHHRVCRVCSHFYVNVDGTVNEEVVQLKCRHTIGVRCAQYLIESLSESNRTVEDPRRCLHCPFCGDVVFVEAGAVGEDISLRRNRGWRSW